MSGPRGGRRGGAHEEEHENHERWLVSYADFITLLFAFFATLYAISKVDAQKLSTVAQAMQVAFDDSATGRQRASTVATPRWFT